MAAPKANITGSLASLGLFQERINQVQSGTVSAERHCSLLLKQTIKNLKTNNQESELFEVGNRMRMMVFTGLSFVMHYSYITIRTHERS